MSLLQQRAPQEGGPYQVVRRGQAAGQNHKPASTAQHSTALCVLFFFAHEASQVADVAAEAVCAVEASKGVGKEAVWGVGRHGAHPCSSTSSAAAAVGMRG